jgi:hypothetical protein
MIFETGISDNFKLGEGIVEMVMSLCQSVEEVNGNFRTNWKRQSALKDAFFVLLTYSFVTS